MNSFRPMKKILLITFALVPLFTEAQNKYGLRATTHAEYLESVKGNPKKELIDLEKFVPDLVLDIRYATTNNFTGEKIYNLARAYARKPVAGALKKIQADLKKQGSGNKL